MVHKSESWCKFSRYITRNWIWKLTLRRIKFSILHKEEDCSEWKIYTRIYKNLYQEMKLTCYLPLIQTTANHYKHNKITFHGIQREISRKRGKHIKSSDFISTIFSTPPSHATSKPSRTTRNVIRSPSIVLPNSSGEARACLAI